MGYIAAAIVVAAAASAYAQYQAGQAQAKVFRAEARAAEERAQAARDAAAAEEAQVRAKNDRIRAMARARASASGVAPDFGSPLLVELENARQAQLESDLILYGGQIQQRFLQQESRLLTYRGRIARRAATMGATTSLLSGVASGATLYARPASTPTTTTPSRPAYGYDYD